jgi:glycosyltransferase involved in cell wall biosynthesis
MTLISAVVLTKNEETNIVRCLNSLQWCQDIVILDSGSEDGTVMRAENLGAKIFTNIQPPPFNIAKQRNWALNNCQLQGKWVLFVDADETIPPDLAREIQRVCNDQNAIYNAFELTPRYLFLGKWLKRTQGYPNWHPRLVKLGEVSFTGGVWEHFNPEAKIGRIDVPYDHFANSKGFSDWLERHDRYSTWDAQHIVDFLETNQSQSLGTDRKLKLRMLAAKLWPFRPLARFVQMYFIRLGFTEGITALIFCLLYGMYEFMTVIKIIEIKREKAGLPL